MQWPAWYYETNLVLCSLSLLASLAVIMKVQHKIQARTGSQNGGGGVKSMARLMDEVVLRLCKYNLFFSIVCFSFELSNLPASGRLQAISKLWWMIILPISWPPQFFHTYIASICYNWLVRGHSLLRLRKSMRPAMRMIILATAVQFIWEVGLFFFISFNKNGKWTTIASNEHLVVHVLNQALLWFFYVSTCFTLVKHLRAGERIKRQYRKIVQKFLLIGTVSIIIWTFWSAFLFLAYAQKFDLIPSAIFTYPVTLYPVFDAIILGNLFDGNLFQLLRRKKKKTSHFHHHLLRHQQGDQKQQGAIAGEGGGGAVSTQSSSQQPQYLPTLHSLRSIMSSVRCLDSPHSVNGRVTGGEGSHFFSQASYSPSFFKTMNRPASIFTTTFNMGSIKTLSKADINRWVPLGYDIYSIGVQECNLIDELRNDLHDYLGGASAYQMYQTQVGPSTMLYGSIALTVFARTSDVTTGAFSAVGTHESRVRNGVNLVVLKAGNKGMTGMAFRYHDSTLAFITAHFASDSNGKKRLAQRNIDAHQTLRGLRLTDDEGFDVQLQHHHTFVMGDLNYRMGLDAKTMVRKVAKAARKAKAIWRKQVKYRNGFSYHRESLNAFTTKKSGCYQSDSCVDEEADEEEEEEEEEGEGKEEGRAEEVMERGGRGGRPPRPSRLVLYAPSISMMKEKGEEEEVEGEEEDGEVARRRKVMLMRMRGGNWVRQRYLDLHQLDDLEEEEEERNGLVGWERGQWSATTNRMTEGEEEEKVDGGKGGTDGEEGGKEEEEEGGRKGVSVGKLVPQRSFWILKTVRNLTPFSSSRSSVCPRPSVTVAGEADEEVGRAISSGGKTASCGSSVYENNGNGESGTASAPTCVPLPPPPAVSLSKLRSSLSMRSFSTSKLASFSPLRSFDQGPGRSANANVSTGGKEEVSHLPALRAAWSWISEYDELHLGMRSGQVFTGFSEGPITFPPSFRWKSGAHAGDYTSVDRLSSAYVLRKKNDGERVPSYTDRILYSSLPDVRAHLNLCAYQLCDDVLGGDHRPISAAFRLTVNRQVIGFHAVHPPKKKSQLSLVQQQHAPLPSSTAVPPSPVPLSPYSSNIPSIVSSQTESIVKFQEEFPSANTWRLYLSYQAYQASLKLFDQQQAGSRPRSITSLFSFLTSGGGIRLSSSFTFSNSRPTSPSSPLPTTITTSTSTTAASSAPPPALHHPVLLPQSNWTLSVHFPCYLEDPFAQVLKVRDLEDAMMSTIRDEPPSPPSPSASLRRAYPSSHEGGDSLKGRNGSISSGHQPIPPSFSHNKSNDVLLRAHECRWEEFVASDQGLQFEAFVLPEVSRHALIRLRDGAGVEVGQGVICLRDAFAPRVGDVLVPVLDEEGEEAAGGGGGGAGNSYISSSTIDFNSRPPRQPQRKKSFFPPSSSYPLNHEKEEEKGVKVMITSSGKEVGLLTLHVRIRRRRPSIDLGA